MSACVDCGASPYAPKAQRCSPCFDRRANTLRRDKYVKKVRTCAVCGAEPYGPRAYWCAPCFREKERKRGVALYHAQHEKNLKKARQRYHANPQKERDRIEAWAQKNPERARAGERERFLRRKARKLGAPGDGYSPQDWLEQLALFGGFCAYCDQPATSVDHVIPLSRQGAHDILNVVPACTACNSSKCDKLPLEWAMESHV